MRKTNPTDAQWTMVRNRAGKQCERCGITRGSGFELHHRQPRKMGGTTRPRANYPSNLLQLCRGCHAGVERKRYNSAWWGWLVPEPVDPATVPVKMFDGWFLLTEDGDKISVPAPEGEPGQTGQEPSE